MKEFGTITLKFGPEGKEGEEPLRIPTGHLVLVVGPNNSGKSLFLREVSGKSLERSRWPGEVPTRIVAEVAHSAAREREIRGAVQAEVREKYLPPWLKDRDWDDLIEGLEQAIVRLPEIWANVAGQLAAPSCGAPSLPPELRTMMALQGMSGLNVGFSSLTIGLAMLNILQQNAAETGSADSTALRSENPLAAVAEAQRKSLVEGWAQSEAVLAKVGMDPGSLDLEGLLRTPMLAASMLKWLKAKVPFLDVFGATAPFPACPDLTPEQLASLEQFWIACGWCMDPAPLKKALEKLTEKRKKRTWVHPDFRRSIFDDCLFLDGLTRLRMVQPSALSPFDNQSDTTPISILLRDSEARAILRELVAQPFKQQLVADMVTDAPRIHWRLSKSPPSDGVEGTFNAEAQAFMAQATPLAERSDGVNAYVGMLAAIIAKRSNLIFIDEPEAFLHPPLVRTLARQLSRLAQQEDWQFFVATHSPALLESCAAVGAEVTILRLTHQEGRSTARVLESRALRELALDPLMRSESALSALFHEGAVICEAASDRVFYQEINERLLRTEDPEGVEGCVYLSAQNWQTCARMAGPLRKMGVPAAIVVDADALFHGEFANILDAAQMPPVDRNSLLDRRTKLGVVRKSGEEKKPIAPQLQALSETNRKTFQKILRDCAEYGVFVVPMGQLEDWLTELQVQSRRDKAVWLRKALEKLGTDPEQKGYVQPQKGDIWDFIRGVNRWILNPDREGTGAPQGPSSFSS